MQLGLHTHTYWCLSVRYISHLVMWVFQRIGVLLHPSKLVGVLLHPYKLGN